MMKEGKMMLVTDVNNREEFNEMKDVMEIFFVQDRIRKLATRT